MLAYVDGNMNQECGQQCLWVQRIRGNCRQKFHVPHNGKSYHGAELCERSKVDCTSASGSSCKRRKSIQVSSTYRSCIVVGRQREGVVLG